ncbi:MAG: 50S ribosomal protein L19, partial [Planctomycetia bacterium]
MSINPLITLVEASSLKTVKPEFDIGDTIEVSVRILDGEKERIQLFTGIVIAKRGGGTNEMFTVRRIVDGEGVERQFPIHSPKIADIVVKRRAVVRRAKLYYLRNRLGTKAMNLKERIVQEKTTTGRSRKRIKARKAKQVVEAAAVAEKD